MGLDLWREFAADVFSKLKSKGNFMEKRQENFLSMCATVDTTCTGEPGIIGSLAALQQCHTDLKAGIAEVKAYMLVQATDLSGWTVSKKNLRIEMIEKTLKLVNGVTAYALANDDPVLFDETNYSRRKLLRMRDEEVDVACKLVWERCSAIVAALADYGLAAADLTAQSAAIVKYAEIKTKPSLKEDEVQVATEGIARTLGKIRKVFKVMDRLVRGMQDTRPEFADKYFNSREIYDL